MTTATKTTIDAYPKGSRWRVVKPGAKLWGMKPCAGGGQQGWSKPLEVGEIITSGGRAMTMGDGVPALFWRDADGQWLANDCCFAPIQGGMWGGQIPEGGYLEPVSE